ncbi:hypothetical protein HaLaN_12862 [Haematococcus lacustris]|uniref:Uncharacterized protein n=1 Tax=Haematococcus lacustris TaxID=44745 RepID=A0A699Z4F3_HAELA|nr:hypothetical protein HaLaN_12862 [Haematococcus lacustris]
MRLTLFSSTHDSPGTLSQQPLSRQQKKPAAQASQPVSASNMDSSTDVRPAALKVMTVAANVGIVGAADHTFWSIGLLSCCMVLQHCSSICSLGNICDTHTPITAFLLCCRLPLQLRRMPQLQQRILALTHSSALHPPSSGSFDDSSKVVSIPRAADALLMVSGSHPSSAGPLPPTCGAALSPCLTPCRAVPLWSPQSAAR